MRVIPKADDPTIHYLAAKAPVWLAQHATLGLTEAQAAEVGQLAAAAAAAGRAQREAYSTARAATLAYRLALARLRAAGSACIAQIRATAAASGQGQAVYSAASVPAPNKPGPLPAPGMPSRFTAQLRGDAGGALRLAWRCTNPGPGTVYEIRRRDNDEVANPVIAVTGKKHFDDETIAPGTRSVTYTVTALRSTRRGTAATHTVSFGSAPAAAIVQLSRDAA